MSPKVHNILKYLLGAMMLIFGLNKFLGFMPFPPVEGDGGELLRIYTTSGFFYLIGSLELLIGVMLLAGKFVPLALTLASAILVNALIFHLLHFPAGSGGAVVGLILTLIVIFTRKGDMNVLAS